MPGDVVAGSRLGVLDHKRKDVFDRPKVYRAAGIDVFYGLRNLDLIRL